MTQKWILCPVCGGKTRDRLRQDTVLKNYPLYCPKCKHEVLIDAKELHITAIKEPDAKGLSQILCKQRRVVENRANIFRAAAAKTVAALSTT